MKMICLSNKRRQTFDGFKRHVVRTSEKDMSFNEVNVYKVFTSTNDTTLHQRTHVVLCKRLVVFTKSTDFTTFCG